MAEWSRKYIDSLPASSFAWVDPATGERHLPYKDKSGKLDAAHVRDALARLDQTDISESAKAAARKKLVAAAKKLGIEVSEDRDGDGRRVDRGAGVTRMSGAGTSAAATGATMSASMTRVALPCEIRIVDEEKREIELCATSEAVDSYGTIFGYDASKAAFERWIGNVREMHERKAVGTRVAVRTDDAAKKLYTRVRISKGAPDTWEKIKDGTLRGASIGASNVTWQTQRRAGQGGVQEVPVATSYDLVELSLVDNPSNPDALGVTFVRDAVPVDTQLADLDEGEGEGGTRSPAAGLGSAQIIEGSGSLSVLDFAAQIASEALARGRAAVAASMGAADAAPQASAAAAEPTPKQRRLAALGAPGYARGAAAASAAAAGGVPETVRARGRGGVGPGAMYDVDGDHETAEDYEDEQSGPGAGDSEMPHEAGIHAHAAHDHEHTGRYDDTHRHHGGLHQHLDGTSHEHDHLHDHGHHEHANAYGEFDGDERGGSGGMSRVQAGHSHMHVHSHDHGHYYRVADGGALDERLVGAEQVRTFAYVSEAAFRAAGGAPGRGLSAQQMRVAMAAELNAIRAAGPYSRNPDGPADAGTPADAAGGVRSTDQYVASGGVSAGAVNELNRDGQMEPCEAETTTGELDTAGKPPDGWTGRVAAAEITRDITRGVVAEVERLVGSRLGSIEQRIARIEAQPLPGGPQLRVADKATPLSPNGGAGSASSSERYRALESLAGRLSDPQAQVAVAAEMIRLQQEAAGMSPALQVMPRAGAGWGK